MKTPPYIGLKDQNRFFKKQLLGFSIVFAAIGAYVLIRSLIKSLAAPHWIASDPYPKDDGYAALNSGGALVHGDSYSLSFSKAGTYTYHDELNPFKLQGTVVVR